MKSEQGRRQPGSGDLKPAKNFPQQQRRNAVEKNVDEMITQHCVAPQFVPDPKHSVDQRVILSEMLSAHILTRPLTERSSGVVIKYAPSSMSGDPCHTGRYARSGVR